MSESQCFSCHKQLVLSASIGRRDECEHCGADIHCCKNCKFYDTGSYNECKETSASVVREKDRANFCDYFVWQSKSYAASETGQLLDAAEALFKK